MASEKTTQILEEIKGLTILEMADLVKALEEEFGVTAAPVAVAGAAGAAPAAAAEEKTTEAAADGEYTVNEAAAADPAGLQHRCRRRDRCAARSRAPHRR